jgi:hypothetical protein
MIVPAESLPPKEPTFRVPLDEVLDLLPFEEPPFLAIVMEEAITEPTLATVSVPLPPSPTVSDPLLLQRDPIPVTMAELFVDARLV